ncbi:hypothetical protein BC829DRAFT_447976 [Chytridium lagenaria]|nr:hypothetical protein BC829DRAFT_447976 [Chytridium lagenaria]
MNTCVVLLGDACSTSSSSISETQLFQTQCSRPCARFNVIVRSLKSSLPLHNPTATEPHTPSSPIDCSPNKRKGPPTTEPPSKRTASKSLPEPTYEVEYAPTTPKDEPSAGCAFTAGSSASQGNHVNYDDFYNDVDINVLIFLVAEILDCLTAHNDRIPICASSITRFHSRKPAPISIIDYLRRIVKHGAVNSLTVHRFIITAITVSCKCYAELGGLPLRELNALELDFAFLLNWELGTNVEHLQTYYFSLLRDMLACVYRCREG